MDNEKKLLWTNEIIRNFIRMLITQEIKTWRKCGMAIGFEYKRSAQNGSQSTLGQEGRRC